MTTRPRAGKQWSKEERKWLRLTVLSALFRGFGFLGEPRIQPRRGLGVVTKEEGRQGTESGEEEAAGK